MFRYLDWLFSEETVPGVHGRRLESHALQQIVAADEERQLSTVNPYDDEAIGLASVHARQDITLLVSMHRRTNILLRWIRLLLVLILAALLLK